MSILDTSVLSLELKSHSMQGIMSFDRRKLDRRSSFLDLDLCVCAHHRTHTHKSTTSDEFGESEKSIIVAGQPVVEC